MHAPCLLQVPGSLIATEETLEFVETRARITAAEFLGLRAVSTVRIISYLKCSLPECHYAT
jgi:ABC-type phosphate transport system permease subunit